jgi:predicted esterase YcpF (UPF0227 family)
MVYDLNCNTFCREEEWYIAEEWYGAEEYCTDEERIQELDEERIQELNEERVQRYMYMKRELKS